MKSRLRSRDLSHYVYAITPGRYHLLYAADLAMDAPQTFYRFPLGNFIYQVLTSSHHF
jgi:hypothetical protein